MSKNFKLNLPGLNELMKSSEMQACLQQAGQSVANAAGRDHGVRVHVASFVAIANVYPTSAEAAKKSFEENNLLKALTASGLKM